MADACIIPLVIKNTAAIHLSICNFILQKSLLILIYLLFDCI
jgi:hypothetical protein